MKKRQGFTMVEIMIVALIIGMLAMIAIPAFAKARTRSREKVCINNLRQISAAKEQWAMETNQAAGVSADSLKDDVSAYLKRGEPDCPATAGSTDDYTYGNVGAEGSPAYPTCNSGVVTHTL